MSGFRDQGVESTPDVEHDVGGSYAIDPGRVRRLLDAAIASRQEARTTYTPFTGQPLASLPVSSRGDIDAGVARARQAQRRWASLPPDARAAVLLRFHDLVLDRQDEILDLIQLESGKSRKNAFEEVAHIAMTARYCARMASRVLVSHRRRGMFPLLTRVDLNLHPKGAVGIISPWNYPFTMALCDGIAALAAGNTVVAKPDAQTALSALLGVHLLREAGLPPDCWTVVLGPGSEIGPALVDAVDYVCFTGSTVTGKAVAHRAAERLIGCSLELGGKNPMLVLHDADVERATEGAVRACFSSAGQLCVSIERIYVADPAYDAFVSAFLRRTEALVLGAGLDYTADVGSLASEAQLDKVSLHVEDAVLKGATVLTGGHRRPEIGPLFYEPTVLTGVRPGMDCFAAETFGPVVAIYPFVDEADAIARANEGEFGLNASVWTRDARRGRALASLLRCGTVNINEGYAPSFGSIDAPMGGMRSSGLGRRQGPEGLLRFTDPQAVATQRLLPIAPRFGMTDRGFADALTAALRALKATRRP